VYARVNTIFGQQDKVAAGVARAEGADRAAVEATRGNRGLTTLMNSDAGVVIAVSYWDDPMHASNPTLTRVRERIAAAAGGDLVAENFAVAWQVPGPGPAWPGATVRVDRLHIDPAVIGEVELALHADVRQIRLSRGFSGAELMLDRTDGRAMLVTTWAAGGEVERIDAVLSRLGDAAVRTRTESYVLVRGSTPI
jgi:hypothetical protein